MRWPEPRFDLRGDAVMDRLTGLIWCRCANLAEFPLTWQEALDFVASMNREQRFGQRDWRLPNRRELRSLLSLQTKLPALPERHPLIDVFNGWYWSTTAAAISPAHAWYVALDDARRSAAALSKHWALPCAQCRRLLRRILSPDRPAGGKRHNDATLGPTPAIGGFSPGWP